MQPIALELILLRSVAPDLIIRPGAQLAARVTERQGRHGIIMLAGSPLVAELPEGVHPGDKLRLRVEELTSERVLMKLMDQQAQVHTQPPPLPGIPLPDGRTAHVRVEDDDPAELDPEHAEGSVAITYESPSLGPIQFHLGLGQGTVSATVRVAPGEPLETAERAADALREALSASTGRSARVQVLGRRDPVDVYV